MIAQIFHRSQARQYVSFYPIYYITTNQAILKHSDLDKFLKTKQEEKVLKSIHLVRLLLITLLFYTQEAQPSIVEKQIKAKTS